MFHEGYFLFGMHFLWWCAWIVILSWIFVVPYDIPGQRKKKDSPLIYLQKRFANGHLTNAEYFQKKKEMLAIELAVRSK